MSSRIDSASFAAFLERLKQISQRGVLERAAGRIGLVGNEAAMYDRLVEVKQFSMLHVDVLMSLWWIAQGTQGAIVEIGPYVGGSTVALALGAGAGTAGRVISVEPGGAYLTHPHIPSSDILADLRRNLATYHVTEQVTIIEGRSFETDVQGRIAAALGGRRVGLLFIDADGRVEGDLKALAPHLDENSVIVVDDYVSDAAAEKSSLINPVIDAMVADGRLERWSVLGWGTWFGRYRRIAVI